MFRRRWSGLPADPVYLPDLKELGYFINDIDEIRSLEDPNYYFKFFLTKNDRWNERQRFAFNNAVTKEIRARISAQGFTTVPLPLGTPPTQPHVPIFTSPTLSTATRVVVFVGEACQSLGVLAHRVIGGRGGITRGSVLSLIAALQKQKSSATDPSPPGLLLANPGELWWWPEGRRGLTPAERHGVPMASAVHFGRYHDPKVNEVPGHRTVAEHVRAVFEKVVLGSGLVNKEATVDVIAVGDGADELEGYLNDDEVWEKVGKRLGCLVGVGGCYSSKRFKCDGFKQFMAERGRAYMLHHTPLDTPVAGPAGNPGAAGFISFGCPVFSAGEAKVTETMLIEAMPAVLDWMQEVALQGKAYKNMVVEIFGEDGNGVTTEGVGSAWGESESGVAEEEAKAKKDDTKAPGDTVKGNGGEELVQQWADKADSNNVESDSIALQAKTNVEVNVEKAEADDSKPKLSPADDGPEAKDMKDLVTEIEDLKINN